MVSSLRPFVGLYYPMVVTAIVAAVVFGGVWIWGMIQCLRNPRLNKAQRRGWFFTILMLNFIGACVYLAHHPDVGPNRSGATPKVN